MKTVEISKGLFAVVDDDVYEDLSKRKWFAMLAKHTFYASSRTPGKRTNGVLMHRLIMGAKPGDTVDHIDGFGLNNQRSNLRLVTRAQNNMNQQKRNIHKRTSRFKGVSFRRDRGKWQAHIQINGKQRSLGAAFTSQEDAARAYNEAAKKMFGEFARLNDLAEAA